MMDWIEEHLNDLHQRGLWRELRTVSSPPGPEIIIAGRPVIQFASNDYLGLAADPHLAEAACAAVRASGAGAAASRLIVGSHETVARLEQRLAELKGTEAALVFPTGYTANLAVLSTLAGPGDAVFADRLCHASILDGIALCRARLVTFRHNDPAALEEKLAAKNSFRRRLVVTESVFSMDGDLAPLPDLAAVARRHGAMFVVDEAHATGVFGPTGAGLAEAQGLHCADLTATVGTLSKALGGLGGFVTASRPVIDLLVNSARPFIFTTGIPPAQAAVALAALDLVRDEPQRRVRLLAAAAALRRRLAAFGADTGRSSSQIIPVILGSPARATAVAEKLLERGLLVPAIRPPTVKADQCRLRISLTAAHTDEQIDRLVAALAEVLAK
jgi:8-amino-7-oxononanoate synthase